MDYCTFRNAREALVQKGERQFSSEFYKEN